MRFIRTAKIVTVEILHDQPVHPLRSPGLTLAM